MSWVFLAVLVFVGIAVTGVSAVILAGLGLALGWGLIAHALWEEGPPK